MEKIIDWTKVKFIDTEKGRTVAPEHRGLVKGALQNFLMKPEKEAEQNKKWLRALKAQEFTVSGDFPTSVIENLKTFQHETSFDEGYKQIFEMNDFTSYERNGFTITDVFDGLTFNQVLAGEKLKVYQMYGTQTTVNFLTHGGALGWHRTLLDDKEYWTMNNTAKAFRNTYYSYKANYHYALIEAIAGTLAWQAPLPAALANTDPTYVANRDAQTLNAAAIQILTGVAGSGYTNVTPFDATFVILAPIQLVQRVQMALNLVLQAFSGSQLHVGFNFKIVPTVGLATTNVYYVILPFNKLISGLRQDLTLFSDFDSLSYTDTMAAWTRFSAVIGDTNQIVRCATA
jgi:hypothetical protein